MNESWHLLASDSRMWGAMAVLATVMGALVKHRWSLHAQIAAARDEERKATMEREDTHCLARIVDVRTRYEADIRELRAEVARLRRILRKSLIYVDAEVAKRVLLEVNTEDIPSPQRPASGSGSNGGE